MLEYCVVAGLVSFFATLMATKVLIPQMLKAGITGEDENKRKRPKIPSMGGIAIVLGLSAGILFLVFAYSGFLGFDLIYVLAGLITILLIAIIGIIDDLFPIPQWMKATLPLFTAIPLIVVKAGTTTMLIPFYGAVDFGLAYTLLFIPLGVAVASNLTNMLAGYNGQETGMGVVIFFTVTLLGVWHTSPEMLIIAVPMLGALLAFYNYNRFPAMVFTGDVGNLTIGGALAVAVIIGNLETAGALLMLPYILDFFIKAKNRFPHTYQDLKGKKLYPKDQRIKGLAHVLMRLNGGITEPNLARACIVMEIAVAVFTLGVMGWSL